jgi:hypothetical protein
MALLFFCYVLSIFLCCLLFACDEFCFAFFMEWMAFNVDQPGMMCCIWMGCIIEDNEWQV